MTDSMCNRLEDFLGSCMSAREQREFEQHLAICSHCQQEVHDQSRINNWLGSAVSELGVLPPSLVAGIEHKIGLAERHRAHWRVARLAAAAVLVFAVGGWMAIGQFRHSRSSTLENQDPHSAIVQRTATMAVAEGHVAPLPVYLSFERGSDAIAVPIASEDPSVSIFWIYPTVHAFQNPSAPDIDSAEPGTRS